MKKVDFYKNLQPIQYLTFGGFIFLVITSICNFVFRDEWAHVTIIPYHTIVIPVVNIISAIICFFVFLFPKKVIFLYISLVIETIMASLTGLETIGVFLFTVFIILLFFNESLPPKSVLHSALSLQEAPVPMHQKNKALQIP